MSIFLHQAIRISYPNATNINGDTQETITAWDDNGNNIEINNWETINTKASELQAIEDAKPSLEDLKASAKTKLMNGEALTEDEANVMVGL